MMRESNLAMCSTPWTAKNQEAKVQLSMVRPSKGG
jgi:hypothetical protein